MTTIMMMMVLKTIIMLKEVKRVEPEKSCNDEIDIIV
jgi:hypothetical protein